jgi:hypothetical protein
VGPPLENAEETMATPEPTMDALMGILVAAEKQLGRVLDWEKHLPEGEPLYTTRDVCNAIGAALTEAGIPNNLKRGS